MAEASDEPTVRDPIKVARVYLMSRPWWEMVLRGLFIMVFGIVAIAWPGISLLTLVLVFGVFIFVEGIFQMVGALKMKAEDPKWSLVFISGLFSLLIGIIAISWPDITAVALLWLIGAWAIVIGVTQMVYAAKAHDGDGARRGLMFVGGLIAVIFGLMAFLWPEATALTLLIIIGFFAIFFGIQLMVMGLMSRNK